MSTLTNKMTGAESLVYTLLAGDINVCFTNPGTSEMHFVAALDSIPGMHCVLGLHENVVTGAADGYARMADKPAATLLHLGAGLANGVANLHNAYKGNVPIVNIVGEHATYHIKYNAPLTSDIVSIAKPVSNWLKTATDADSVSPMSAEAIQAARTAPGGIATFILPANTAWGEIADVAETVTKALPIPTAPVVSETAITKAVEVLQSGERTLLLLGGKTLREDGLALAGKIKKHTGAEMLSPVSCARMARGEGRVSINKIPYPIDQSFECLAEYKHIILVNAAELVAFFGYPGKPSLLAPEDTQIHVLSGIEEDGVEALARLVQQIGTSEAVADAVKLVRPVIPTDELGAESIAQSLAYYMPDNAIIVDEAITSGRCLFAYTQTAPKHDWLQITGGAIGIGMPLATGAAIACPDRKVITMQADGSGMYTLQALWTQAREQLDVLTILFANRSYEILKGEMRNVGVENPGPRATDMLSLDRPELNWKELANGMGVRKSVV